MLEKKKTSPLNKNFQNLSNFKQMESMCQ